METEQDIRGRAASTTLLAGAATSRFWLRVSVSVAVALAFADASIAVLALPQIVDRLHTSISHVIWVIGAYNLALIVGALAIIPMARRLTSRPAMIAGLGVFGLASLGSGVANTLTVLVVMRCVQGLGGALLLCASLPLFADSARPGESPLASWAAAAAFGAAVGPAIGGLLTQVFDWRAIFLAQAPFAALAAVAAWQAHSQTTKQSAELADNATSLDLGPGADTRGRRLNPPTANLALTFLSAGLIGALFLVTVLLINAWGLTPFGAAAIVSAIPLATLITERVTRGLSPVLLALAGAVALGAGLVGLALVTHRELAWVVVSLALCGAGLGLAFPALTGDALRSSGKPVARAARTVAARDAGLLLGLLILTPVFVHELDKASKTAVPPVAAAVYTAPIPVAMKNQIAGGLLAAYASAPQSQLPDLGPTFKLAGAQASPETRVQLALLESKIHAQIERAATHSFRRPLLYCALFALLVIPLIGLRLGFSTRPRGAAAGPPAGA
jgi:Major Facilitator Superfamily